MSLRDRLAQASPREFSDQVLADPSSRKARDAITGHLHYLLIEEMGPALDDLGDGIGLRYEIERRLREHLREETTPLSEADRGEIIQDVVDNVLGYGPIESFLNDPSVTEVMVNNPDAVYIERAGKIHRTDRRFVDEDHLRRIIDKIVGRVGRRIDESSPLVDARLPDGSRVNAIIHPLAVNGPMLTIRKFSVEPYTAEDLVGFGSLTPNLVRFLEASVRGKLNVLISGGTGTGKTTLLNVLSSFVPHDERIVTIEDAAELRLNQEHVLRLESRPANIEGKGQVTIRDLVRNSLRMRPDRIIVGEVRGGEALDMLQAMNTGHEGSLSTIHANSARDALARLETMVMMAGFDLPVTAIRQQACAALDLIVHLTRLNDGSRRATHVTAVEGMEGETIVLQDIFYFDYSAGLDPEGRFLGRLKTTGLRPKVVRKLEDLGIVLQADLFEYEPPERA
ncbi:MAG: CpaF family protein [Coriobacteriia bacterium]|nr:CpaF family protein [Coriobacteriia bacterium]